MIQGKINN